MPLPMLIFAVISAVAAAASTYAQMEAQRKQKEYQAQIARNNALAKQQQADLTRRKTEVAMRAKDVEKKKVRRGYMEAAGTNKSLLAAGNVDLTTGSALDLLEGNYNRFADDMGELEYQKDLIGWEGEREAQLQEWQGDVELSNASYLEGTAGTQQGSLLGGVISGGSSFASSYASAGGFSGTAGGGKTAVGGGTVTMLNSDFSEVGAIA